jgi:hypothetical protein
MLSDAKLTVNNRWADVYEAVFSCFKQLRSFEPFPWDTEGNRTIFVMVDGLWICNQPVMSR